MRELTDTKQFLALSKPFPSSIACKVADFFALSKIKLSLLVVITSALGYWLAFKEPIAQNPNWSTVHFLVTVLGILCFVFSANALNQVMEREFDALMERTKNRPLPSGRMNVLEATAIALVIGSIGAYLLFSFTNLLTLVLALVAWSVYLFAYTPLKRKTPFCTAVGAISGALPPVIGWTAVKGEIGLGAALLFSLQFLWQFPHFWLIAWMYSDDYSKAGFKVLPKLPTHLLTKLIVGSTALVVLIGTFPVATNLTYFWLHFSLAFAIGCWLLVLTFRFSVSPSRPIARNLLALVDAYLPLILLVWLFKT